MKERVKTMDEWKPDTNQSMQNQFYETAQHYIKRARASEFLNMLSSETDFFTAPASTRFHLSTPGGLCEHSLNVFNELSRITSIYDACVSDESIAICALYHDVCKANYYEVSSRNVKANGVWTSQPYYTVNDQFPMGHGEKSVYMLQKYISLTDEEAIAIRWHMGGFDETVRGGNYSVSAAYDKYPLALLLHMADMVATHMIESIINA